MFLCSKKTTAIAARIWGYVVLLGKEKASAVLPEPQRDVWRNRTARETKNFNPGVKFVAFACDGALSLALVGSF